MPNLIPTAPFALFASAPSRVIALHGIDIAIIAVYFVAVLAIGFYLKGLSGTGEDFFLAGREMTAWIAGLSFLSANLGSLELMGWAGAAYQYGILAAHWYWIGAIPAMLFLGLVMMPFYYISKTHSVPGYLKLRYGEDSRLLSAVCFGFMTVLMSGINMYSMALVMKVVLGWDINFSIWVSSLTVAVYVALGGLRSAIFNEVLQFMLIWLGALLIPIMGVLEANLELVRRGLVLYTFGNASGVSRADGLVAIKPSGVPYETMKPADIVLVDLAGKVVEGSLRPSSDVATHVLLYREFPSIGGVVHTHSRAATSWAQAGREIPCFGTTHADYFYGSVPVAGPLTDVEIESEYEVNTGRAIVRRFHGMDPLAVPAVLVCSHGPFAWGRSVADAAHNAVVLEEVAEMAARTLAANPAARPVAQALLDKHHFRKHGAGATYGQGSGGGETFMLINRRQAGAALAGMALAACKSKTEMTPETGAAATMTNNAWGKLADGRPVELHTLKDGKGMEARITTYGGILVSLKVPDKSGMPVDVVLGFDQFEPYLKNSAYFGALIGRYGNRIGHATFQLDGKTYHLPSNDGENSLHGGGEGFNTKLWTSGEVPGGLQLAYLSKDGDAGYPGNLSVKVTYSLTGDNGLKIDYFATTNQDTVVNLTNHSYFNLAGQGEGPILDHEVAIMADAFTPVDKGLIPTGKLQPVEGTPFDFRQPTAVGARIDADHEQLKLGRGYDHNWVLNSRGGSLASVVRVREPKSGRVMEVLTDQPGVQFYTGNFLDGTLTGKGGKVYPQRAGLCLETQHFPDSPNKPQFPTTVLKPGAEYKTTTVYKFSQA